MPDQVPDVVKHERLERLVDVVQRVRCQAECERVRPRRGGARRGAEPDGSGAAPSPNATQHDRHLHGYGGARRLDGRPHQGATSTTLRGIERAASPPSSLG